ncbi:hypothetical protein BGZ61DRAFT_439978 [Ilyonectria robusta]|uniref:uncharacterized protein n=1 Tax=Ilyonectria robusta TaxID=1079257 RepID=UPI001E8E22EB|nr:uncharacterized protein BGZ61DRAFT_439978 [Ilyonectria robusta]KAH8738377.1 hypothetical protein BGZ61DRAFT_439978 [Ilyonectria robusta]
MNSSISPVISSASSNHEKVNCGVLDLPVEIIAAICSHLPNSSIKHLRLSCAFFSVTARLQIERVFLSAHQRDIEVLHSVANSEILRSRVVEIIYDDALLAHGGTSFEEDEWILHLAPDDVQEEASMPDWFNFICTQNEKILKQQKSEHADQLLSQSDSWSYYRKLLQQQDEVLNSNAVLHALETGLEWFPALRRITITPAAHGWLFEPLYMTPTIRAFPHGFNYPVPSGWLPETADAWFELSEWDDAGIEYWGLRLVMQALARSKQSHQVTDVRIEANELITGLNSHILGQPGIALTDLATTIARPAFRHLHLDLFWEERYGYRWPGVDNDLLGCALAGAAGGRGLEYLSLAMNGWIVEDNLEDNHSPFLQKFIPPESLASLKHFRLSGFYVNSTDLLTLLAALPTTLERVELILLQFIDGSYEELLVQMKNRLDWRNRNPRPVIGIGFPDTILIQEQAICIDDEVNSFIYNDGENPFLGQPGEREIARLMRAQVGRVPWANQARWPLSDS